MARAIRFEAHRDTFEYYKDSDGEPTLCVGCYLWGKDIDRFIRWVEKIKAARQPKKILAPDREPDRGQGS